MAIWQKPEAGAHRSLALRGLVRLADESNAHANDEILGRYRDLVQGTRGDEELRLVLGALGGMAYPGALELALPLLAKPGVRAEAEVTVRRIAEAVKDNYPQAAKDALAKLEAK